MICEGPTGLIDARCYPASWSVLCHAMLFISLINDTSLLVEFFAYFLLQPRNCFGLIFFQFNFFGPKSFGVKSFFPDMFLTSPLSKDFFKIIFFLTNIVFWAKFFLTNIFLFSHFSPNFSKFHSFIFYHFPFFSDFTLKIANLRRILNQFFPVSSGFFS